MNVWIALLAASSGYFIGAISFTRIVGSYVLPGVDVSKADIPIEGSEKKFEFSSFGATSIRAKAGSKYGCLTSFLDMVKVTLPTLAFRIIYPETDYFLITAAAGVSGHNFPVYYRFKGGRGLSSLYGGLVVIDWLAIPVTTIVGLSIGFWLTKFAFLSFFGVTLILLPWFWFRFHDVSHLIYALAINIFFWIASVPDIKMYIAHKQSGEFDKAESRFAGLNSEFTFGSFVKLAKRFGWKKKGSTISNTDKIKK